MITIDNVAIMFDYSELKQKAQERAKNWYMETRLDNWHYSTIVKFVDIGRILGITFKIKGGNPCIYFSRDDNYNQVWFSGYYDYKPDAVENIRKEYPDIRALEHIALMLDDARRESIDPVKLEITYDFDNCMTTNIDNENNNITVKAEKMAIESLQYLAEWFYKTLDNRYLAITSESYIESVFTHGDIKFLVNGTRLDY